MSEEKPERRVPRRDRGEDDEFEAIVDSPDQEPLEVHVEVSPIDPWDDILDDGKIKYRTLAEAYEDYRRERERKEGQTGEEETP